MPAVMATGIPVATHIVSIGGLIDAPTLQVYRHVSGGIRQDAVLMIIVSPLEHRANLMLHRRDNDHHVHVLLIALEVTQSSSRLRPA